MGPSQAGTACRGSVPASIGWAKRPSGGPHEGACVDQTTDPTPRPGRLEPDRLEPAAPPGSDPSPDPNSGAPGTPATPASRSAAPHPTEAPPAASPAPDADPHRAEAPPPAPDRDLPAAEAGVPPSRPVPQASPPAPGSDRPAPEAPPGTSGRDGPGGGQPPPTGSPPSATAPATDRPRPAPASIPAKAESPEPAPAPTVEAGSDRGAVIDPVRERGGDRGPEPKEPPGAATPETPGPEGDPGRGTEGDAEPGQTVTAERRPGGGSAPDRTGAGPTPTPAGREEAAAQKPPPVARGQGTGTGPEPPTHRPPADRDPALDRPPPAPSQSWFAAEPSGRHERGQPPTAQAAAPSPPTAPAPGPVAAPAPPLRRPEPPDPRAPRPGEPPAPHPPRRPVRDHLDPAAPPRPAERPMPPPGGEPVHGFLEPAPRRPGGRPANRADPDGGVGYVDGPGPRVPDRSVAPPGRYPADVPEAVPPPRRPPPQPPAEARRPRPERPEPAPAGAPVAPRARRRLGLVALVLVVALVSGLAGGVVAVVATRNQDLFGSGTAATGGQAASAAGAPEGTAAGDQLQRVLGAVLPAVVKVEARTDTGKATGSGVIFANGGYVLTNAHVVDRAQSIGVTLSTSEPLRARFVGRDLNTDLAVLKVRRAGLTVATVGRSADLRVGDAAIVVGSPFGFQSSVTTGIVSALHRVVKVPDGEGAGEGRELVDAIQTDAAINPGNSGGALANASGEVVGISTAIATNGDAEANAGVGFAIPIDEALEVATALVDRKPVRVPFLGVDADPDLSPEDVQRHRLGSRAGALVSRVAPRSPAADAGLRRGDLVIRFGDQPVGTRDQLTVAIRQAEIGVPVPVIVVRRGRQLVLQATPSDEPER